MTAPHWTNAQAFEGLPTTLPFVVWEPNRTRPMLAGDGCLCNCGSPAEKHFPVALWYGQWVRGAKDAVITISELRRLCAAGYWKRLEDCSAEWLDGMAG